MCQPKLAGHTRPPPPPPPPPPRWLGYTKQDVPVSINANEKNVVFEYFTNWNVPGDNTFVIRYFRDSRYTNLVQKIEIKGTNVFFDGVKFDRPK